MGFVWWLRSGKRQGLGWWECINHPWVLRTCPIDSYVWFLKWMRGSSRDSKRECVEGRDSRSISVHRSFCWRSWRCKEGTALFRYAYPYRKIRLPTSVPRLLCFRFDGRFHRMDMFGRNMFQYHEQRTFLPPTDAVEGNPVRGAASLSLRLSYGLNTVPAMPTRYFSFHHDSAVLFLSRVLDHPTLSELQTPRLFSAISSSPVPTLLISSRRIELRCFGRWRRPTSWQGALRAVLRGIFRLRSTASLTAGRFVQFPRPPSSTRSSIWRIFKGVMCTSRPIVA